MKKNLNLWLPTEKLSFEKKFEKNWESTSDSIATWLYSNTESKGVVFIKSISFTNEEKLKLKDLQKKKILDLNVKNYVKRKKNLKIIGPEIIDLFENSTDWEYIVSKLNKVIV